jgi:ribosomal protein S12 methylthiotransferase accessory factor
MKPKQTQGMMDPCVNAQRGAQHWELEHLLKYSTSGVERSVHPRTTIRRAREVMKAIGVTTVSDITRLDRVGIPNYMTVRPRDKGPGISYYNGKGLTIADAHAGALMEAVERHAGETCLYERRVATFAQMVESNHTVNPADLVAPGSGTFHNDLPIEWVEGYDLLQRRLTWVPLNAVICPYETDSYAHLFHASSNGLASGNSLTEAVCHALCEVIERDAQAMSMALLRIAPIVAATLGKQKVEGRGIGGEIIHQHHLPLRAGRLLRRLRKAGLSVELRDLSLTAGIATIECTLRDDANGDGRTFGGLGTHPDSRIALTRAITEAAQSRLTFIQGGREDIVEILRHAGQPANQRGASQQMASVDFADIPTIVNQYIDEDISFILSRLPASGIEQIVAFDLTHPDAAIPVVRLVVPKAETWTVFHLHMGRGTLGTRVLSHLFSQSAFDWESSNPT